MSHGSTNNKTRSSFTKARPQGESGPAGEFRAGWRGAGARNGGNFLGRIALREIDRKSTRLNSSHVAISYAVFCLKKKKKKKHKKTQTTTYTRKATSTLPQQQHAISPRL